MTPAADDAALPGAALERLEQLGQLLSEVTEQLAAVARSAAEARALAVRVDRYSRRNRQLGFALGGSFVLDIVLTVVVTILSIGALNQNATIHASQLTACAIGNQGRASQEQLWAYLFQLTGGVHTPQQKAAMAFVDKTFAPVNCAEVYKT
jgi:hypothetical protein